MSVETTPLVEKYSTEQIEKVILVAGEALNVTHKIAKGEGVFSILALIDELSLLATIKKDDLVAQLKDIDQEERKHLLEVLKSKISLSDKALEGKIEGGVDCLDAIIDFGFKCYADVMAVSAVVEKRIEEGKVLVEQIKAIV